MAKNETYDKRDDFNFPIVNFPFICSKIPAAPVYGVYSSQCYFIRRSGTSCMASQEKQNEAGLII
jgi:hypothetical protein